MKNINKNLYITYSNQKSRDLKSSSLCNPLDKINTLDSLILELFERDNFEIIIDETIGSSLMYKFIQENSIEYFDYLESDALGLNTIYSFLIKCNRSNVSFDVLHSDKKLEAIVKINNLYSTYKRKHSLVDIADIEKKVFDTFEDSFKKYTKSVNEILVDDFKVKDISFIRSYYQKKILEKLSNYKTINNERLIQECNIIEPSTKVFDNIDEVKTAIKIARKLLEDGDSSDDIIIVASDINEYAPLYKLFLDEYKMKGFSSIGTPLTSYLNSTNDKIQIALNSYKSKVKLLENLYKKLDMKLSDNTKEQIKSTIKIQDEKIGVELTEPNQIVGLTKSYKHVIFIGTDINHFPPKTSDNFLYTYEDEINHFYTNNYFINSAVQYEELKRVAENLYIITASYSGKRELSKSILLNNTFDETIDVSKIKSINELALENQTIAIDLSYMNEVKVEGIKASHLSASQINNYLGCPLRYLFSSKLKLKAPNQDEEGFDVMEQGSLMHLCYELFGRKIKDHYIKTTEKEELYELMYDISIEAYNHEETTKNRNEENIHHKLFLSSLQAGLKDDRDLGLLAKFVEYYIIHAEEFNYFKDTEFEKEFALDNELKPYTLKDKEDKNYFIRGFIDRFDNLKDVINIVDYKSKKVTRKDKDKQEEVDTQKDIQLALYILYASQAYSNKTYDSHLLSFKGNEKGVKFATLTNDDIYTKEFEDDLKKLIFDTKNSIEDGEFGFNNSDEKICGYCDYKFICHESLYDTKNGIKGDQK